MKLRLSTFLMFVMLAQIAYSQEIEHYTSETEISQDLSTTHEINIIFSQPAFNTFQFQVEGAAYDVATNSSTPEVTCSSEKKSWGVDISCDFSKVKEKRFGLKISHKSSDYVKPFDNFNIFRYSYKVPLQTSSLFVSVKLPEGYGLIKQKGEGVVSSIYNNPYTPQVSSIGTDGRRITLIWQKNNLTGGEGLDISVSFEKIQDEVSSKLIAFFTGSVIGLLLIIFVISALFVYFFKNRFKKDINVVLPVLKADEKAVIDALLKQGGQTNQKVIVKESNYSKAKVSKVLKSLAERNLVKLERVGRTNKVYLVKEYKKEEQNNQRNS